MDILYVFGHGRPLAPIYCEFIHTKMRNHQIEQPTVVMQWCVLSFVVVWCHTTKRLLLSMPQQLLQTVFFAGCVLRILLVDNVTKVQSTCARTSSSI